MGSRTRWKRGVRKLGRARGTAHEQIHRVTADPSGLRALILCLSILCMDATALHASLKKARVGPSKSHRVSSCVVMLCKGTAITRVVNAGAQDGLEVWRALVLHHEPSSLTRNVGVLQQLLNFSFEGEIAARMVQFDRDIDRYEKTSGENFPSCQTDH